MSQRKQTIQICVCKHQQQVKGKAANNFPSRFELKAGTICLLVVMGLVYLVNPWWALVPPLILLVIALVAGTARLRQGHSVWCATRRGLMVGVAAYANVLEALNPGNWI